MVRLLAIPRFVMIISGLLAQPRNAWGLSGSVWMPLPWQRRYTVAVKSSNYQRGKSALFPCMAASGKVYSYPVPAFCQTYPGHLKVLSSHTVCVALGGGVCVINGPLGFLLGSSVLTLEASNWSGEAEAPSSLFPLSLIQETKASRDFLGLHHPSFKDI